jgi:hypothetical protein
LAAFAFLCPLFFVAAQPLSSQAASTPQSAAAQADSKANDDWLNHVRSLYTSTARDGLKNFDCALHPDWRALISSANNGDVGAEGERKIAALQTVRISMHAHMTGSATVDWDSGNPPADLTDMMNSVRDGTRQTLDGFLQFWTPFADASVIPTNSQGIEFTPTAGGGRILRGSGSGTTVTETFDAANILIEYDVKMPGTTVLFTPTFTQTPKGLRVTYFLARIKPDNGAEQELRVRLVYGEVDGFTIPSELFMTVVGTGTFNFTLDGCRVNP